MGAPATTSGAGGRLKREDFKRTKHDSAFSPWKILIGASDWKDHSLGKEGAEKYKTHNLPNCASCPGVYELGVAISRPRSGRETRKLESSSVIPIYLGQADNVRTRLQQYGRQGSHLKNVCSNNEVTKYQSVSLNNEPDLFMEIFSKGFPIVYRWAPMRTKKDAEKTESNLLDKFDYAWNKGSNGARRPDDVLKKIDYFSRASQFSLLAKKLQVFNQKRVGIKIETSEPFLSKNTDDISTDTNNKSIFSRIFKINRSRPIPVSSQLSSSSHICGVAIGHGSICSNSPVQGRKRCTEHKGMKINGLVSKLNKDEENFSGVCGFVLDDGMNKDEENFSGICGFVLDDGSLCRRAPFHKNKRCLAHKGRRIRQLETKNSNNAVELSKSDVIICGVNLENGQFCTRQPVLGRKRCDSHKGMRLKGLISKLPASQLSPVFYDADDKKALREDKRRT